MEQKNKSIYIYIILLIDICVAYSCSTDQKEKQQVNTYECQPLNSDTIDTSKKNAAEIVRLENINQLESLYYKKIYRYKDSIVKSVNLAKIPKMERINRKIDISDPTSTLRHSLETGDMREFIKVMDYEILLHKDIDPIPYYLYMAEKHKKAAAYKELYNYLYHRDSIPGYAKYIEKPNLPYLKFRYMKVDLRNLAFWSLLTSYNKGNLMACSTLASYFRDGDYFPKDTITANILDSLYRIRPSDDISLYK